MNLHEKPLSAAFISLMKDCGEAIVARIAAKRLRFTLILYDEKTGEWSISHNHPSNAYVKDILKNHYRALERNDRESLRGRLFVPR